MGSAFFYLDYRAPVGLIREKLKEICERSKNWNGRVVSLQVTDTREGSIELRALMSANSAGQAFDLRCEVRERPDRRARARPGARKSGGPPLRPRRPGCHRPRKAAIVPRNSAACDQCAQGAGIKAGSFIGLYSFDASVQ